MQLKIPDFSLVVLIGASGAGKSTFAARHFLPTEVLSSDRCRGWVSDDESDQDATGDAFDVLRYIAAKRLAQRRLTVVDATNLRHEDRRAYIDLARQYHAIPVAIALDVPESECAARNEQRPDRQFGGHVVRNHVRLFRRSIRGLKREGFRHQHVLRPDDIAALDGIAREPLYNDRRGETGPFDIIGDVHGCLDELRALLAKLGYEAVAHEGRSILRHPGGRRALFVGDLVDRGPDSPGVLRLVMDMCAADAALCVPGNHEARLIRKLRGRDVKMTHGLAETMAQIEALPEAGRDAFVAEAVEFMDSLVSHFWLDGGRLVVAHAGMKEEMQGRGSGAVRAFALYGETTGETDEFGLPVRFNWASEYRGKATVVYGHVPTPEAEWINKTICIDTGCVFGGKLTALRYPELELVDIAAAQIYSAPVRPLVAPTASSGGQAEADRLLDMEDVTGKRVITTGLARHVRVDADNAAAALEIMTRFCVDPRWLIHLPPTMSPPATSALPDYLEHPAEVIGYFEQTGIAELVAQEKHMGSRAIAVVARDERAAANRFGVSDGRAGVVYTRTGRPFFSDAEREAQVVARLRAAAESAGLWDRLETDWLCLDCEIMPWSVKAGALIDEQYRPVAMASVAGLDLAGRAVAQAIGRGLDLATMAERIAARTANAHAYRKAYEAYNWPVDGIAGLRIAPFHLLASEAAVHHDKPHAWHLEMLGMLAAQDEALFRPTRSRTVDLADARSRADLVDWWTELTEAGGEGLVIKPASFTTRGKGGLVQPAIKCRGREYLRIIYGPDYTLPEHMERLRARSVAGKRRLALREFALGMESLTRFVAREPLRRVHECVFAVLALETEPVDPRL